jgi:hypothetical protein
LRSGEVAAHLPGRPVVRVHLPAGVVGKLLGQEVLLDQRRNAELLLDPLASPRLRLLPADQLGHLKRRRRLRGQRVEELEIWKLVEW